jgi:predicted Ser/Thr protein kinase/WD40 repeat protein
MPIASGTRFGPYEILASLGAGGMGEVYRARDTKLDREVAIKVLPDALAQDPDRLARFEREAKVLASLNHPNIAQIYGIEERALVMELVPGETLKGPLPLAVALDYARQIAEALDAAHEKGIVHRDLKPANVIVTPEGIVKVLDFGLAAVTSGSAPISGDPVNSPTLTMQATQAGVIMGTAAYMSPEQACGKPVDKRADIWSFGVVLFEMLSGRRLFGGETISHTLADVLRGPIDFDTLPKETPAKVRDLLRRCLERNVKNRLRDIGDARITIEEVLSGGFEEAAEAIPQRRNLIPWIVAALLTMALGVAGAGWWRAATQPIEPNPLTRLSVDLGPDAMTGPNLTVTISPDGRRLVFPARGPDGKQQLATRLLDQAQVTLLPGTENGRDAFFSPDNQWVGFFAVGKLKKISVQGGAPVTLCAAPADYGASWGEDGNIVVALGQISGLSRIPSAGGDPQPLTQLSKLEGTHQWPQILPGGQAVLFTAATGVKTTDNAFVEAISLKTGAVKTLFRGGYFARYLPANGDHGYLIYLHQGVLLGVAFDAARLEVQGTPTPLLDDVAGNANQGGGQFDFSAASSGHGILAYLAGKGAAKNWPVMWLDGSGKMEPLIAAPGVYGNPAFSPDGRRLALASDTGNGDDIYVYDLGRQTMTRLTLGAFAGVPVWTPDGNHIAFQSIPRGQSAFIGWVRSDGSGEPRQLLPARRVNVPWSFSPDGKTLAYFEGSPTGGRDLWTVALDTTDPDHPKPGKPELFLGTPADELGPMFSPDGRWIAYRSSESGPIEVYVRPFPAGRGGKWQISTGGGLYPIWSKNGRELFYETTDNRIMVVDYTVSGETFVPGKPRLWTDKQIFFPGTSNLALAPDGKRFAVFPMPEASGPDKGPVHVTFLLNFLDELRRRIPRNK